MIKTGMVALLAAFVLFLSMPTAMAQEYSAEPVAEEEAQQDSVQGQAVVDGAPIDPMVYLSLQEAYQRNLRVRQPELSPRDLKTIFFTRWQHALLLEHIRKGELNPQGTSNDPLPSANADVDKKPGIRELSLGGILYKTDESWIVWLNGQRVTPDAIPTGVMDIKVRNEFIELKWYDSYTNLIYPIRLRPHQRFNLDSRMFLPGTPG